MSIFHFGRYRALGLGFVEAMRYLRRGDAEEVEVGLIGSFVSTKREVPTRLWNPWSVMSRN